MKTENQFTLKNAVGPSGKCDTSMLFYMDRVKMLEDGSKVCLVNCNTPVANFVFL